MPLAELERKMVGRWWENVGTGVGRNQKFKSGHVMFKEESKRRHVKHLNNKHVHVNIMRITQRSNLEVGMIFETRGGGWGESSLISLIQSRGKDYYRKEFQYFRFLSSGR